MPNKRKLREDSLWTTVGGHGPPWLGRHGSQSVRQLVTLHLQPWSIKTNGSGGQLIFFFWYSPGP